VVDFIDMEEEEHRQRVLEAMEEALVGDRSRTQIHSMTELGLMELTRKRVRESLARQLSETCPTCDGRGIIKSRLTVAYEVMGEFAARARQLRPAALVANVHPEVHDVMVDQFLANITELGQQVNCDLRIHPKGSYHPEQFDLYASDG
jgi:ribonuclease G